MNSTQLNVLRDALVSMYGEETRLDCIPLNQQGETGMLTLLMRQSVGKNVCAKDIPRDAQRMNLRQFFALCELGKFPETDVQWSDVVKGL
jgi:hypothetical protein